MDEKVKRGFRKSARLGDRLRESGVKALYIGDGNHNSTMAGIHQAMIMAAFKPELLFLEIGAEKQQSINEWTPEGRHQSNFSYEFVLAKEVSAKVIAVDDSEDAKQKEVAAMRTPSTCAAALEKRVSVPTNHRIADRIANSIFQFKAEHGRLPSYAVMFGSRHFHKEWDIDEMVEHMVHSRGLVHKAKSVAVRDAENVGPAPKIQAQFIGPFDFSVLVSSSTPKDIPDLRASPPLKAR